MKVLHVSTGFPYGYNGGITNYVRALVEAQRHAGIEADVLSGGGTNEGVDFVINVSSKIVPFSLKLNEEDDIFSEKVLNALKKYDLIHFHMAIDFPISLFDKISRLSIKYVVSLHDYFLVCPRVFMADYKNEICHEIKAEKCDNCCGYFDGIDFLRKLSSKVNVSLPRYYTGLPSKRLDVIKRFLNNASLLLPVSNKVKEIYEGVVPSAKFKVIHIGNITANQSVPTKMNFEKIIIGMLGTLSYIKGAGVIERVLENVKNKNVEFHFYGRADKRWLKKLERLGLKNMGSYQQDNLREIVSKISIGLVSPIWEDNAPQVVMEFLNFGTPVIATKRGGIVDFISHNENGYLFEPNSDEEFNNLIKWIDMINVDVVHNLSYRIKKLTTPEKHAENIINVYTNI